MPGSRESVTRRIQSSGDNSTCVPNILPTSSDVYTSVPVHEVTKLGIRSYPTGSSAPEAITFSFFRSDKLVYTTMSFRPISPCQSIQALAGPVFSHLWNSYSTFPGGVQDLYGRLYTGLGCPYELFGTQSGNLALHQWVTVLRGHQGMIVVDNTTVVSYINKQGGAHSHTLLVVDLFLWLQTQDIAIRDRHIPCCLNVIADHLSWPNQPPP